MLPQRHSWRHVLLWSVQHEHRPEDHGGGKHEENEQGEPPPDGVRPRDSA